MTIKVHELAKELNMSSKELVEKAVSMGIEAKNHMSILSDIEAIAVRNTVMRSSQAAETKIVKVAPKKTEKKETEEPRIVVKAAAVPPPAQNRSTRPAPARAEERPVTHRPPIGKPVVSKELDARTPRPPIGRPVVPAELESRTVPQPPKTEKAEETADREAAVVKQPAAAAPAPPAPVKQEPEKGSEPGGKEAETKGTEPVQTRRETAPAAEKKPESPKPAAEKKGEAPKPAAEKKAEPAGPARSAGKESKEGREARPARDAKDRRDRSGSSRPEGARPPRDGKRGEGRESARKEGQTRRDGGRPASSAGTGAGRPAGKRDEGETRGAAKDRDKFARLEKGKGKKPGTGQGPRSLEKTARPKNKKQSKPKQSQELEINMEALPAGTRIINVPITVAGFCEQAEISTSTVIMKLMKLGIMANINQNIDEDTVLILAEELGIQVHIGRVSEEVAEEGIEDFEDKEADLKPRPPIITVMGHVDHGKTSLLDAIRKTNVTASESGGITQHIGASEVVINGQKIVFLDTPGHEAFTAMRARGAHVTDIAVLVVAADDSVKPQTIESISHAKAAGVPIIVAVNKVDKPEANPDRVKQDLTEHGILVEEWGGETICVPVSAKTGEGIVNLLEMILLQAEVLELRANPNRLASGTVIEARLDKTRGTVATLLVLNGTLQSGQSVVAGTSSGKIKLMTNFKGDAIKKAGPATAVEILGLADVPEAGDVFHAVKEDRIAREIAESRKTKLREEVFAKNASTTLEQLFSQLEEGQVKELNLIIKGDVQGSVGALEASLEKLRNEKVRVKIIHSGVGTVTESDVMLAGTAGAIIIGFNVRPSTAVTQMADREGIEIRTYRVIYNVIDDIEAAMKGMLDPVYKEVILGNVEVREIFKVPGVGTIAGAYVTDGKVVRNAGIRLVRDGIVIHEGKISSLKRFKDDAKEVLKGFECGIGIENYNDIKEGDVIECFQMEQIS